MKKKWNKVTALIAATTMTFLSVFSGTYVNSVSVKAEEKTLVTDEELDAAYSASSYARDSVHDPSIVVDSSSGTKTYYVFGSHMGVSKTTDLMNWTSVTSESVESTLFGKVVSSTVDTVQTSSDAIQTGTDAVQEGTAVPASDNETVVPVSYNEAFRDNAYKGKVTILVDGVETEVDFGTYNASEWNTALDGYTVQGNMWAPDVIYNPTMGKWCMYLSLNGSKWNSVIILLTADSIEGPYVYQGPVIYSGFNGNNTGVITYDRTDLSLVYPGITDIPEKYKVADQWGSYYPHAIDPCVSYDENGNLWMVYGSWSGGIYAIQLDETTGLRDYTVTYPDVDAGKVSCSSDAYFGTKIAGGAYVSGEGAYIEKIGNYWYLFVSYGFYSPDGGYEMRVFRSETINGSYTDGSGQSACYSKYEMNYGVNGTTRGEKLMSGYQWDTMSIGEISEGHNSAFVDSDGNAYVVYHTKFNDGTAGHQLRVHQLYVNEDGWLTTAPYEYAGETVNDHTLASTTWEASDIVGDYQVIIHKYGMDYANMEVTKPSDITLNEDGTVTGDYTGTWVVTSGSYVNVVLDGVTYKGELVEQTVTGTNMKTLCFTAASTTGVNVWGSKSGDDLKALALTRNNLGLKNAENIFPVGNLIYQNVNLPVTGSLGTEVTWTSDNEAVLSHSGVVTIPAEDTEVHMTCTLTKGSHYYEKTYTVKVVGESSRKGDTETGKVALFEFEGDYADSLSTGITGVAEAQSSGTLPSIKKDRTLGSQVAEIKFGYDDASSSNYVKFANPLKGSTTGEATVSMAVKRSDADVWDALWGFMDSDASDGISGRAYLTGNAYLGFNGTGGYFDANHASTVTNAIPVSEWSLVTVAMDTTGFDIYVDGVLKYTEESCLTFGSGDGFSTYESLMNLLASADTFYLGYGSWWGSDPFRADDLTFYNRSLSASDVAALYAQFEEKLDNASKPDDAETTRSVEELKSYITYFNDFEEGAGDATVVGGGTFEDSGSEIYGQVYHNATTANSPRTNYLKLPEDVIANATSTGSKEMSIGVWVNVADAENYFYAPLFSAYKKEPSLKADGSGTENTWPMFILQSRLVAQVNCAGYTDFEAADNVAGANKQSTEWLDDKEWHYYTATITEESVKVYVDGVLQNEWELDSSAGHTIAGLFTNGADLEYVCLGGNQAWDWADDDSSYQYDDIALYSTAFNAKEVKRMMNDKLGIEEPDTPTEKDRSLDELNQLRTYFNDFEKGAGDATVVGDGTFETDTDENYGTVYHNATTVGSPRTNYLKLPEDVIANATSTGSKEMSVGMWVNVADAENYFYAPLFSAYEKEPSLKEDGSGTQNTWPMFALQSRLVAQVNCAGYTDFEDADNVAGANKQSTEWLDDKEWHYYTATITEESVKVYVDGVLKNEWELDSSDGHTIAGLFTNGADLKYVCLGGNQAWDWADVDASYEYDDIALYSTALSQREIFKIMAAKNEKQEETSTEETSTEETSTEETSTEETTAELSSEETSPTQDETGNTTNQSGSNTGDSMNTIMWLLLLAGATFTSVYTLLYRRRER